MNPYEVLEISVGASPEEIKAAYHGMAKKWHPDRYTGAAKAEAEERFRLLAEAYGILKDTVRAEERPVPAAPPPAAGIQLEPAPERPAQGKTPEEWFQEAKAAAGARAVEKALGLVQYAIRLDGDRGEYHALLGKLLDETNGDKRNQVRALETALRKDPRDVESTILLARTYQNLGMHAKASRLWNVVRNLAPNHPVFSPPAGKGGKGGKGAAAAGKSQPKGGSAERPSLGEQFNVLVAEAREAIRRLFKRG